MLLSEQGFDNQIDQYSVKKVLGYGGAGQVMLVQHKLTNEKFAMKLLPADGMNEDGIAQINREIALQTRCKHCPNVVRFKEHFKHENLHCIVMERMEGGDLQQMLERRSFKPITVDMARKFTHSIALALKYLHEHEIIHRDVKLENVMLTSMSEQSCEAKLTDFGLALRLN